MLTETQRRAFISYSRVNKEFAAKLVKGLRSAGFAVWFDLLDIPTGSRWDDEVEKALHECQIFLIILTPASIASDNVKDEIGYAIDHNKRILPILLEPCNVPLRLRRFQYVDFTAKSFDEGFQSAQDLLRSFVDSDSQPLATTTAPVEASIQSKPEPAQTQKEPVTTGTVSKPPVSKNLMIGIVSAVVLLAAVIGFSMFSKDKDNNDTPPTDVPVVGNIATQAPVQTPTAQFDVGSTKTGDDGMTLLYVPAGEFKMGGEYGEINESPVHAVNLNAFWIDKTEVTNKMYAACVKAGACESPTSTDFFGDVQFDNFPVVFVTWEDANAYCGWSGERLPTEAEWEKAARSTDERVYPWGNTIDETFANYGNKVGNTTEVGKYPRGASLYGTLDMTGNVAEWVSDWFDEIYYESSPATNPPGPDTGELRVLRGGSWSNSDYSVRAAFRGAEDPTTALNSIGFRCALSSP